MSEKIVSFLNSKVPNCNAVFNNAEIGSTSVTVDAKKIKEVCFALRDGEFEFNVLQVISGVDRADCIEVNYILASFTKNDELILRIRLERGSEHHLPEVESVYEVWKAADYQERECFDMIGVRFLNHPNLIRILCPYDWQGHPLRKDYVVQEKYLDMVVNPANKMNYDDHEFGAKLQIESGTPKKINVSWKGPIKKELKDRVEALKNQAQGNQNE